MQLGDKILNTTYYQKLKRVGNKLAKKYLAHPNEQGIAKNIPMKYLDLFYKFSKKVKPLRIRYRGKSKLAKLGNGRYTYTYQRPASFCHKDKADSFAIYHR